MICLPKPVTSHPSFPAECPGLIARRFRDKTPASLQQTHPASALSSLRGSIQRIRQFIALLICLALFISACQPAAAQDAPAATHPDAASSATLAAPAPATTPAEPLKPPVPPRILAASAILVDADTGQVIYAKNEHVRRPNASTTKVMTVLLALEHGNLDETVSAPKEVTRIPESSFHLVPGEKLPLIDLLYAACVRSANDAAWAIAAKLGPGVPKFVNTMNARAKELGMKDTHFKNPNGLNAAGHYSSAYDLALLTREALKLPLFNQLVNTRAITIARTSSQDKLLKARSRFLLHYPGADGVKSGYTRQAGYCYIGSATINGWRLISVVLKSSNAGEDTRALMSYGFDHFERVTLARAGAHYGDIELQDARPSRLPLILKTDLAVVVPKGRAGDLKPRLDIGYVNVPLNKGDVVGRVVVSGSTGQAQAELIAGEDARVAGRGLAGFLAIGACIPFGYAGVKRAARPIRRLRGELAADDKAAGASISNSSF